jgi:hypothetical protein
MKLLLLYGPEASGKSTIGVELARRTGWPLLANHDTLNIALRLYSAASAEAYDLSWAIRREILAFEGRQGRPGIVLTWAYSLPHSQRHWQALVEFCAARAFALLPVRLRCDADTLRERVVAPGRAAAGMVSSVAALDQLLLVNRYPRLPGIDSLEVDTTRQAPGDAANAIVCHFRLEHVAA